MCIGAKKRVFQRYWEQPLGCLRPKWGKDVGGDPGTTVRVLSWGIEAGAGSTPIVTQAVVVGCGSLEQGDKAVLRWQGPPRRNWQCPNPEDQLLRYPTQGVGNPWHASKFAGT